MDLRDNIAPCFYDIHRDIRDGGHTEYWLKGGRGSTKSSFVSIEIILGMMKDAQANAAVFRKVKDTCRESVFEQLLWAVDILGVADFWKATVSPMAITYLPTGQKIIFRGLDNAEKVKSGKLKHGYFKYLWFEELPEFSGMAEIRKTLQTFMRGGDDFAVFCSYNPPISVKNWVNQEATVPKVSRLVHHSTYLDVLAHPDGANWLGKAFIAEAEHIKRVKPKSYEHEYLGAVMGTGGEIFDNIEVREIADSEIAAFDNMRHGVDWGYSADPFAYVKLHYDKTRRRIYFIDEIYEIKLSNREAAELIKAKNPLNERVTADNAEPKSIDEVESFGVRIWPAVKGPGSIRFGIKWLQALEAIVIDPVRCPNVRREFTNYELEKDKSGVWIAKYPDRDNHTIDAARYAMEGDFRGPNFSFD